MICVDRYGTYPRNTGYEVGMYPGWDPHLSAGTTRFHDPIRIIWNNHIIILLEGNWRTWWGSMQKQGEHVILHNNPSSAQTCYIVAY